MVMTGGYDFDDRIGTLVVSMWISSMLFTVVLYEALKYFILVKGDTRSRRLLGVTALILDLGGLLAGYAQVYIYTVKQYGDLEALSRQNWPFSLIIVTDALSCLVVDSYLVHRYFYLSRNWYISTFLGSLILLAFSGGIYDLVVLQHAQSYANRHEFLISATLWLSSTCAADVCIAVALLYELFSRKSPYKSTNNRLHHLIWRTIQTGSATSLCAVLGLITYLSRQYSNVATGFVLLLCHLYAITILSNLNIRLSSTARTGNATSRAGDPTTGVVRTHFHGLTTAGATAVSSGTTQVERSGVADQTVVSQA